jgi:hypothetical protein
LCAGWLALAIPHAAAAVTLTFEETGGDPFAPLAAYGGFAWTAASGEIRSIDVPAWVPGSLQGWYIGVGCMSGGSNCTGAYNVDLAATTSITRDEAFAFLGADFASSLALQTVDLLGFAGGQQVFSEVGLQLSDTARTTVAVNWTGVDEIRIVRTGGRHEWVMDNFAYAPVPEPGTYALFAAGLGLVAWSSVRRRPG